MEKRLYYIHLADEISGLSIKKKVDHANKLLMKACEQLDKELLELAFDLGADPKYKDEKGRYALNILIRNEARKVNSQKRY